MLEGKTRGENLLSLCGQLTDQVIHIFFLPFARICQLIIQKCRMMAASAHQALRGMESTAKVFSSLDVVFGFKILLELILVELVT